MVWLRLFSSTTSPGHRDCINRSLSSSTPAFSTNSNNALNSRGVRFSSVPSLRNTRCCERSSTKLPKA